MRLTRRFIVKNLNDIVLSEPIRYERYYINDKLRIQKKNGNYEKEILNDENVALEKSTITKQEFLKLKKDAYSEIIRDSYLYLDDERVSIKKYYGKYEGLNRVEIEFASMEEKNSYEKESWMDEEITDTSLAFDKYLSKLNRREFLLEMRMIESIKNDNN